MGRDTVISPSIHQKFRREEVAPANQRWLFGRVLVRKWYRPCAGHYGGSYVTLLSPRALLTRLIAFDTTSHRSNLELIAFAANLLADRGWQCVMTSDASGEKQNLFASLGPRVDGGLVLSGHSDVVPAMSSGWESDPFTLREADERFYGRGTCDMKGFIATVLYAGQSLAASALKRPLHIALSYDEEVGCLGVPRLLETLDPHYPTPRHAVIGEPTMLQAMGDHKGILRARACVHGKAAHSSLPELGSSAISAGAGAVASFYRWLPEASSRYSGLSGNIGLIKGGTAGNIIADLCTFSCELRYRGEVNVEELLGELQRVIAPAQLDELLCAAGLTREGNEELLERVLRLAAHPEIGSVPYMTEAGLFQRSGMQAVVCGPGNIAQAHQSNEYISLTQFSAGLAMVEHLIAGQCRERAGER